MNYFIKKRDLFKLLDKLKKSYEVIAPVKRDIHRYEPIKSADEIDLNFINTTYPLKKWFLPAKGELFNFSGSKISAKTSSKKRILFAVRPCDVNALLRMDKLFLDEYVDSYYKSRRQNTILIALNCSIPGDNCFCTSLGTHKLDKGFDLLLTETKAGYIVQLGSEKGRKLIDTKLFTKTTKIPEIKLKCNKKLTKSDVLKLKVSFYHSIWKDEAENCLSCGACTMTCPTCGCFRIVDSPCITINCGSRNREWTSCQLKNFTVVAGGHSFREDRAARLKNRIYHQLEYFKDKFGINMCVGCGRCITNCPTKIDMTQILKSL